MKHTPTPNAHAREHTLSSVPPSPNHLPPPSVSLPPCSPRVVDHQGDVVVPVKLRPTVVLASKRPCARKYYVGAGGSHVQMIQPQPMNLPTLRLFAGKGKKFSLTSDKALERFRGGITIPGIHRLKTLKGGRSRCQVCRAMGERGSYGPNKTVEPPRAKMTCENPTCGDISLCSVDCSNV